MRSFLKRIPLKGLFQVQLLMIAAGCLLLPVAANASAMCAWTSVGPTGYGDGSTGTLTQTCSYSANPSVATGDSNGTFSDFGAFAWSPFGETLTGVNIAVSLNMYISDLSVTDSDPSVSSQFYLNSTGKMSVTVAGTGAGAGASAVASGKYNGGAFNASNNASAASLGSTVQLYDVGDNTILSGQTVNADSSIVYFGTGANNPYLTGTTIQSPTAGQDNAYCGDSAHHCTAYNDTAQGFGGLTYANSVNDNADISTYQGSNTFTIGYSATALTNNAASNTANFHLYENVQSSGTYTVVYTFTVASPEPSTWLLSGSALLIAGLLFRKRRTA